MSAQLIRQYLRAHPDGARIPEIAAAINRTQKTVGRALDHMDDCFIDRWVVSSGTGGYGPVWCAVEVPEHCPKPERP